MDLTSIRTQQNKVKLSFFAEDTLCYILGSYYNHWHGYELKEKKWKHLLKKLVSKLEIAIKQNLTTDHVHLENIKSKLNRIQDNIKEKDNTDPEIIFALFSLCFELLGDLPSNGNHRFGNKEKHFDLSLRRSLHYIQSHLQKVRVIFQSANYAPFNEFYSYDDISSKLYLEFSSKPEKFLDWYKAEYPKLYSKLF